MILKFIACEKIGSFSAFKTLSSAWYNHAIVSAYVLKSFQHLSGLVLFSFKSERNA
jgi:hypothetical protein